MKLWSIHPVEVYDLIQNTGAYTCDRKKAIESFDIWDECYKDAYDWLVPVMAEKVGAPPIGVEYPVWAWHTYNGKRKHSDLRQRHGERGQQMVCMELEVPDNKVILTDFDNWHFVLNNFFLGNASNEKEYEKESKWFDSLSKEEQNAERRKSWYKIFNLTKIDDDWRYQGFYIQACFWVLKKEYIRKVKFFRSK